MAKSSLSPLFLKAGELHQHNRGKGITLTAIDCLINAAAVIRGHKIATRNVNHYPDKKILFNIKQFDSKPEKHKRG